MGTSEEEVVLTHSWTALLLMASAKSGAGLPAVVLALGPAGWIPESRQPSPPWRRQVKAAPESPVSIP